MHKANQRCTSSNAVIWAHNSDRYLIQFNEVSHTGFSGDEQGFNMDLLCFYCVFQYKYSHDNVGDSYLICSQRYFDKYSRNIIRYNIRQNHKRYTFTMTSPTDNIYIYNNKIYTNYPEILGLFIIWIIEGGKPDNIYFQNNIIYYYRNGKNYFKDTLYFFHYQTIGMVRIKASALTHSKRLHYYQSNVYSPWNRRVRI